MGSLSRHEAKDGSTSREPRDIDRPFPYIPSSADPGESQNDFDNAQVSHLVLNQHGGGVLSAKMIIKSIEATSVFARATSQPRSRGSSASCCSRTRRRSTGSTGQAVRGPPRSARRSPSGRRSRRPRPEDAHDRAIWGMGRHNHENSVPVPLEDFDGVAVLSGDDTFVSNPAQSQLYSYVADSADDVWNDDGDLYAFVVDQTVHRVSTATTTSPSTRR